MASRGLRISGSGTVSTRMSVLPFQQTALMGVLPASAEALLSSRVGSDGVVEVADQRARAVGLAVGGRDLAGLHELLEAPQVLAALLLGGALQHLAHRLAERGAADLHAHAHDRAAAVR